MSKNSIQFMPLGMGIGVALGAAFDNIPLWMCLGLAVGLCIGTAIDAANKAKDK